MPSSGDVGAPRVLPRGKPRSGVQPLVFCVPFAGGTSHAFTGWDRELAPLAEVVPVELPAHGARYNEAPNCDIVSLVDEIVGAIRPHADSRPYALFGHSMGALLAYETAVALSNLGRPPVVLVASGCRAPSVSRHERPIGRLSDDAFVEGVAAVGGLDMSFTQDDELRNIVLPGLRADFVICETYSDLPPSPSRSLSCPVRAYGGLSDPHVSMPDLDAWQEVTRGSFVRRLFPGGHLFVRDDRVQVTRALALDLSGSLETAQSTLR